MNILAMDVGRGTQDILIYDPAVETENSPQMILPARTVLLADRIGEATRAGMMVVLRGSTMGGGPITRAARRHLQAGYGLLATEAAAATFSDDPAEVEAMGVRIIDEPEAARWQGRSGALCLETADVDLAALRESFRLLGVRADFSSAAVAVQDHGAPPPGQSDRRFRFEWLRDTLSADPELAARGFDRRSIPARFTRMRGVAASLPDVESLLVMDTGFAALLGACSDAVVAAGRNKVIVNAGNGHTLAALVEGTAVRSLFEHHTRSLDEHSFQAYLDRLTRGTIDNEEVFADGGHGAWHGDAPFPAPESVDVRSITGPRRRTFAGLSPGWHQAAPFGSMMQTGCFGLLAAFHERHRGLPGAGTWPPS